METTGPLLKKKKLSLSRSRKKRYIVPQQERFQLSSSPEVAEAKKGHVHPNTQKSTAWAVHVFEDWRKQRNAKSLSEIIPDDVLLTGDNASLCEWLCVFSKEASLLQEFSDTYAAKQTMGSHFLTEKILFFSRYIDYSICYSVTSTLKG